MISLSSMRRLIGAVALPAIAHSAAAQEPASPVVKRTAYEDLQMFGQVLNQIRVNHPDSVDAHELFMAAIEGMIHAADPHSYVIPFVRLEPGKEQALRDHKLVQVPVTFAFVGGAPIVVSVAAGSAARQLDILPGDELIAAEGAPVTVGSAEEVDMLLAGKKGTSIKLSFERRRADGSLTRLERAVKRESVDEATAVPVATMLDSTTGYARVTTFVGEKVADDLHSALDRLERGGMKRLVLDLRDNGGGSVAEAARVAGEFLPRGAVVYSASGRKAEITDTGRVQRSFWRSERRYPIVLMVNAGTASASELVAGALQDHDRALIVGHPTFGKSLLMRGFPMSDGSVLVLVVGHVRHRAAEWCSASIGRSHVASTIGSRERSGTPRDVPRAALIRGAPCTAAGASIPTSCSGSHRRCRAGSRVSKSSSSSCRGAARMSTRRGARWERWTRSLLAVRCRHRPSRISVRSRRSRAWTSPLTSTISSSASFAVELPTRSGARRARMESKRDSMARCDGHWLGSTKRASCWVR